MLKGVDEVSLNTDVGDEQADSEDSRSQQRQRPMRLILGRPGEDGETDRHREHTELHERHAELGPGVARDSVGFVSDHPGIGAIEEGGAQDGAQ